MFNTHVKISQIRIKIIKDQELVLENSGFLNVIKKSRQAERKERGDRGNHLQIENKQKDQRWGREEFRWGPTCGEP